MGVHHHVSTALAVAAGEAYEHAEANLVVIDAAVAAIGAGVDLAPDRFADLVRRFHVVLDTNRTAPSVMRIMVLADAARVAAGQAAERSHGWRSRRFWRREYERVQQELVSQVAATLDALLAEAY